MAYRGWAKRLAPRIQVRPAALPGRELRIRESPQLDLPEMARAVAATADRPYAIYGHSMGGTLALDLVQAVLELGAPPPERIIVGGSRPPHRELLSRLAHLPDQQFMQRVKDFGGMDPALLAQPELQAILLPVLRADFVMLEARDISAPVALPVPITAVAGLADPHADPVDVVGWAAHTSADFQLYTLPGEHFFLHTAQDALLDLIEAVLGSSAPTSLAMESPLDADEVLVVDARLDELPALAAARDELSVAEARRAQSMRDRRDGDRFAARSVVQRRLCAAHGLAVGTLDYQRGNGGKPGWESPTGLRFNASHSAGIGLFALTRHREVGVDVERVRPMADLEAFVRGALDAGEREEFEELAGSAALEYALRVWTAKEATLKLTGDGLGIEPTVFGFAGQRGLTRWSPTVDPGYERLTGVEVRHLDLVDAIGALALPIEDSDIRLRVALLRAT